MGVRARNIVVHRSFAGARIAPQLHCAWRHPLLYSIYYNNCLSRSKSYSAGFSFLSAISSHITAHTLSETSGGLAGSGRGAAAAGSTTVNSARVDTRSGPSACGTTASIFCGQSASASSRWTTTQTYSNNDLVIGSRSVGEGCRSPLQVSDLKPG